MSANGFEVDVAVRHELTRREAIVECKAHAAPVHAKELTNFIGKRYIRSQTNNEPIDGFMFAIPRLTADGKTAAGELEKTDKTFRYLDATQIAELIERRGLVQRNPPKIASLLKSDPAIIIAEAGIYFAMKVLNASTRTPHEVVVWHISGDVPEPVLKLLSESSYTSGIAVRDLTSSDVQSVRPDTNPPTVVEVSGSHSAFEYQLPASPRYFVGPDKRSRRAPIIYEREGSGSVVKAKSGWGKSSLALRMKGGCTGRRRPRCRI